MINQGRNSQTLDKLPIEEISWEEGFSKRCSGKIDARSFVVSFFKMLISGQNTLGDWAVHLSKEIAQRVSLQALDGRLHFRHVSFARRLLEEGLQTVLVGGQFRKAAPECFQHFKQVVVEDSTCVRLPDNLKEFFPGNGGKHGTYAQARIQLRLSLLDHQYTNIELSDYRHNDHSYAAHIVEGVQPGWLCIRDLGYWRIAIFRALAEKGAFFLSRLKEPVILLDKQSREPIDLLTKLKRCERHNQEVLDREVLLGKQERLPVRLVAVKVPPQIYEQKLRKAKQNKDPRLNYSEKYLRQLRWNIWVTNVPAEVWSWRHIQQAYASRWRIEIVFKCWKSKLELTRLFAGKQTLRPARVMITFYLYLLWVGVFFTRWYDFFLHEVYKRKKRYVSMLKFATFFKTHFMELLSAQNLENSVDIVAYYCVYDRRRDRCHFLEKLYMLLLA